MANQARLRADARLRELVGARPEVLRRLLARYPSGSVNVFDRDLCYLFTEGGGLAEVGLSPDRLVGRTLAEAFPAADVAMVEPHYRRALAGEEVVFDLPFGDLVWEVRAAPLVEDADGVAAIMAVAHDVTARRRAEREREEFLDAVAQDLRNPLTTIKATAQLLRRHVQRSEASERRRLDEGLALVVATATRVTALVEDLTDAARLRGGQPIELRPTVGDLVALARACAAQVQAMAPVHAVRADADPPSVVGSWDEARIGRVLVNVLANAVRYSPEGGDVVVRVARATDGGGAWAVVTVADQGIGIPTADLPRVFERFHRAGNVGSVPGTGLGLAGGRQIVEQHGGSLAIASTEGAGTTVTVRLPLPALGQQFGDERRGPRGSTGRRGG